MPILPSRTPWLPILATGLLLASGLAIGCTPEAAPGAGPSQPFATKPTTHPTSHPSPGATATPGGSQTASVSFQTQVVPLLQGRCAACHSGSGSGGVSLFDTSGNARYTTIKTRIASILSEVSSGAMPQGGPRLSESDVQLLESWREAGAQEN